jgi:hypothetical protein
MNDGRNGEGGIVHQHRTLNTEHRTPNFELRKDSRAGEVNVDQALLCSLGCLLFKNRREILSGPGRCVPDVCGFAHFVPFCGKSHSRGWRGSRFTSTAVLRFTGPVWVASARARKPSEFASVNDPSVPGISGRLASISGLFPGIRVIR